MSAPATPATAASAQAAPAAPAPYTGPRAGTLTYSGRPVIQNGEVVFERLPPLPMKLAYDTTVWTARVVPGSGNSQRIILRNSKPGTQKVCVVQWEIVSQ